MVVRVHPPDRDIGISFNGRTLGSDPINGGSNPSIPTMSSLDDEHYEKIKQLSIDFPIAMKRVYCGASFGSGWLEPVREALAVLDKAGAGVAQIKEKFGGLRLYWDAPETEEFTAWHYIACSMAVKVAESKCWKLCESCGVEASVENVEGWLSTLCTDCKRKGR